MDRRYELDTCGISTLASLFFRAQTFVLFFYSYLPGMFYWMESVQKYDVENWNYMTELRKFVDGGFKDRSFIDSVSGEWKNALHIRMIHLKVVLIRTNSIAVF